MTPRRSRTLLAGAWTAVGLVWTVDYWLKGRYFLRNGPVPFGTAALYCLTFAAVWAALTPVVVRLLHAEPLAPPRLARGVAVHVVACAAFAGLAEVVWAFVFLPFMATPSGGEFLRQLQHNFIYDYGTNVQTYVAVVGIAWGVDAFRAMREKERRSAALETELVTAELLALKAQLRPHFLFNALNSVVTLMSRDVEAASKTVVELAGLLRLSLSGDGSPFVPLAQEIDFVRRYLSIEETRFSDRLIVSYELDEALLDAEVPPLVLQPLAENAVRHGIAKRPGRGRIVVRARRVGEDLEVAVLDDGPGPGGPRPGGLGLANTRARLERLYGDRQSLELIPGASGGTEARLVLPLRLGETQEKGDHDQDASRGRRAARA